VVDVHVWILQLGLLEDQVHTAVETAAATVDADSDDHDDEIEKILQAATTGTKLPLN